MNLRSLFDIPTIKSTIEELEKESFAPDFWSDNEKAQKTMQQLKKYKDIITSFEHVEGLYNDVFAMIELIKELEDTKEIKEVSDLASDFIKAFDALEMETLLSGEYDDKDVILTLHAGTGGTEACDWTNLLYRMYTRYAEQKGFKVTVIDYLDGDSAGLKSITLEIKGINAYGLLKSEKGVHRLVRISPFDSSGRRHTSFASCDVMPLLDDEIDIEISDEDLKVDTYRAGGAGGQHVNVTDSAIRITHIPTGIVVQCQNERSQHANREFAMKMLKARLFEYEQEKKQEKLDEMRGSMKEIGWSSQIRSYVFHPYSMVKDHRTNVEVFDIQSVMDGNLDPFVNAYLRSQVGLS